MDRVGNGQASTGAAAGLHTCGRVTGCDGVQGEAVQAPLGAEQGPYTKGRAFFLPLILDANKWDHRGRWWGLHTLLGNCDAPARLSAQYYATIMARACYAMPAVQAGSVAPDQCYGADSGDGKAAAAAAAAATGARGELWCGSVGRAYQSWRSCCAVWTDTKYPPSSRRAPAVHLPGTCTLSTHSQE